MNKDLKQGFYIGAGFALAWYCFMPNLNLLFREKMYRSQQIKKAHHWLSNEEVVKVLIYSDQGLRWIKNTDGLNHQKEMDKFIDNIVSKPRRKIKEFVAFVKDKYFAPEGEEVDNEDFIRRWNGAYEILNVQD